MALDYTYQSNWTAGEISPDMYGRIGFQRYRNGAKSITNFRVLQQGGLTKRAGLRHVADVNAGQTVPPSLYPFQPSVTESYLIEAGDKYFRFLRDGALLPGNGAIVTVPYEDAEHPFLVTTQLNDLLFFGSGTYPIGQLSRVDPTNFVFSSPRILPPATFEGGHTPNIALTLSSNTGTGITITGSGTTFLAGDIERQLTYLVGRAVIRDVVSPSQATADVLDDFLDANGAPTTSLPAGEWKLEGSPVATLVTSGLGPPGAVIEVKSIRVPITDQEWQQANLLINGDFGNDLTGWTDLSGPTMATGTHNGSPNARDLTDTTADFLAAGVVAGHRVINDSDTGAGVGPSEGRANVITTTGIQLNPALTGGVDNTWSVGDSYTVRQTGSAFVTNGKCRLLGGESGRGQIEQSVSSTPDAVYAFKFDASGSNVTIQAGDASGLDNVLAASSFAPAIGDIVYIQATRNDGSGTPVNTLYLSVLNNQDTTVEVDNLSLALVSHPSFRNEDVGKYIIESAGGFLAIRNLQSSSVVDAEVLRTLETDATTPATQNPIIDVLDWRMEENAWSDFLGHPRVLAFADSRLLAGGTARFPNTHWASAVNDFTNFGRGPLADQGLVFPLASTELNVVQWIVELEKILVGTTAKEYRDLSPLNSPLSQTSVFRGQSTHGSDFVQPAVIDSAVVFIQSQGSKVRELIFDEGVGTYDAADMTIFASHVLATSKGTRLRFQKEPVPTAWIPRADGVLLGFTRIRRQEVQAWFRVTTPQGFIRDVAVSRSQTTNAYDVYCSVERNGRLTIEQLGREDIPLDGYVVSGTPTIGGLGHLEGLEVEILVDGKRATPQTVTGGVVTADITGTEYVAGLAFNASSELLPPVFERDQAGKMLSIKTPLRSVCRLDNTGPGLHVNTRPFPDVNMPRVMDTAPPRFTGDTLPITLEGAAGDLTITVSHDLPFPCTIVGVAVEWDVE